jgi:hypothetical protein
MKRGAENPAAAAAEAAAAAGAKRPRLTSSTAGAAADAGLGDGSTAPGEGSAGGGAAAMATPGLEQQHPAAEAVPSSLVPRSAKVTAPYKVSALKCPVKGAESGAAGYALCAQGNGR